MTQVWKVRARLTALARSNIAWPAMSASSGLSLISKLMTWIGRLNSPPRARRSIQCQVPARAWWWLYVPSQTKSKHLSSQVITTSANTTFCSCHFSGAVLTLRFRSNMGNKPLRVYLNISKVSVSTRSGYGVDLQCWVFGFEIAVYLVVGCSKSVYVWLINSRPG